jgi:hypothetical protein
VAASEAIADETDCGLCAVYMLGGVSVAKTRELCSVVNEPFVFEGASGVLLLSRFPIEEPSAFLAPSTLVRREIVHARVRHPTGAAADVFCGYSPPIPAFPRYAGVYGAGATSAQAWRNERKLYFQRLKEWVDATQRAPRSLVMGGFGTSPSSDTSAGLEPDDYAGLIQQFPLAAPAEFVPVCTVCESSPLVEVPSVFADFVTYRGAAVPLGVEITRQDLVVQVKDALGQDLGLPLSSHYGFRSRLRILP